MRQCIRMAGTSRRPNVATSQRRDVESIYKEVNKLQRCDVSASFSSQSLKGKWEQNLRGSVLGNLTNLGAEIRAAVTSILEKSPRFVLFLVLDIRTDVLYISYWYFLIHYVLDLYLGYC